MYCVELHGIYASDRVNTRTTFPYIWNTNVVATQCVY